MPQDAKIAKIVQIPAEGLQNAKNHIFRHLAHFPTCCTFKESFGSHFHTFAPDLILIYLSSFKTLLQIENLSKNPKKSFLLNLVQ